MGKLKKVVFPYSLEDIIDSPFEDKDGDCRDMYLERDTIYVVPKNSVAEKYLRTYKIEDDYKNINALAVLVDGENRVEDFGTLAALYFEHIEGTDEYRAVIYCPWGRSDLERIVIPETYQECEVTEIDVNTHFVADYVKELVIPSGIRNIRYNRFNFAKGLQRIFVSSQNNYFSTDGIALLSKDGTILYRVFCFNLHDYQVPDGVVIIDKCAFNACESLEKVKLPTSIKEIRESAFEGCSNLETVEGLQFVQTVGNSAFEKTKVNQEMEIVIVGTTLVKYKEKHTPVYVVPTGVECIAADAFNILDEGEDLLQEVVLPGTLKVIEKAAFSGRKGLKSIKIPEGVNAISECCFRNCSSLKNVRLPNSLECIRNDAFDSCVQLETIDIPVNVKEISNSAFPRSSNLKSYWGNTNGMKTQFKGVYVCEDNPNFCSVDGVLYSKDKKVLYYVPENYDCTMFEIPEETCIIKSEAFCYNRFIEEVVFQGNVHIEEYGFYHMEVLKSIRFSDNQERISKGAFYGCRNLKTISLPHGLSVIEERAFLECGIQSLIIPESVEAIGEQAFDHNQIEKVDVPKSVTSIGKNIFGGALKEICIYDNIECNGKDVELDFFARNPVHIESAIGLLGASKMVYGSMQEDNTYFSDYIIKVKSIETGEVINRVYMPGKSAKLGRENLEFAKCWNRKAEFNFETFDDQFPELKNVDKLSYVVSRLLNPNLVDEKTKEKLVKYLSRMAKDYVKGCIDYKTVDDISNLEEFGIIKKSNIDELIAYAKKAKKKIFEKYLLSYKEEHFVTSKKNK